MGGKDLRGLCDLAGNVSPPLLKSARRDQPASGSSPICIQFVELSLVEIWIYGKYCTNITYHRKASEMAPLPSSLRVSRLLVSLPLIYRP